MNTAISISKDVGIIEPHQREECKIIADHYRKYVEENEEEARRGIETGEYPIALDGEVFRVICGGITKEIDRDGKIIITLNNRRAFKHTIKKLKIISRASSEDKFILVFGLKELGNIVAFAGSDANDAPTLKQAHVGFSMNIKGTDIAKDTADIILLDDSLGSIVTACKYGRNIYDNIRKFLQFHLTSNFVFTFMTFFGSILLKNSPFSAIQMLWVNLIMDSFAYLSLATEPPTDSLLNRKSYSPDASLITPWMQFNFLSQSIFQIVVLIIIFFYGDSHFGVPSDRGLQH